MDDSNKLNKEQKQAIGLLSIGTFLEYFDLMLYIHMAVLLNELFFPKTDPFTASLLSAFAFCSTYLLRPFGALILGYIGDHIGRRATVVITTFIMSLSCVIIMANLPTYAQIGISAAWLVTIYRITQGMCAMGEGTGAEIYLTELINPPIRYPAVAFVVISATLGTTVALAIASFVISNDLNWRIIFYIYFPVVKRFTYSCLMYALSRSIMSTLTSFGLVYLIHYFGSWGILFVMIPVILGYKFGLSHFESLEREAIGILR